MTAFYNEIDRYCCDWLQNLMDAGHIMPGKIDDRSIADISPDDVAGFTRVHFFAGIGGWDYALHLAGWPDDRPVWTGSCPCQPFSVAGKQAGFDDPRHLWPQFRRLISIRKPATVFGEQVAGAADWLRLVRSDLEEMGYAVGAMPIQAASADAEHFRDRYWFVADRHGDTTGARPGDDGEMCGLPETEREPEQRAAVPAGSREGRSNRHLADDDGQLAGEALQRGREQRWPSCAAQLGHSPLPDVPRERVHGAAATSEPTGGGEPQEHRPRDVSNHDSERSQEPISESGNVGAERAAVAGSDLRAVVNAALDGWGEGFTEAEFRSRGFTAAVASIHGRQYIECPDGKWRRLPPSRVRWLGVGIPARVAKLRAFGNAIDPRPAAEFIRAYLECERVGA